MKKLSEYIVDNIENIIDYDVDAIVFEENSEECQKLQKRGLIVEHNVYKPFGNTTLSYRIDKGD